ncbi:FecR family protein [Oricola cellulosilytica]|uniref:FecR protein domain-containing protein n=1 Tax=Oricola cellulosilytica TaxID=1429082 RepID=A0A4R0PFU2_9HYPH|nr:FecR domain-containing protein [Oricola cellulosilytica]TCD15285.1 hypothetical protein E0D97_07045 [Oricola cellulosilytica]
MAFRKTTSLLSLAAIVAPLSALAPSAKAQSVGALTAESATVSKDGARLRAGSGILLGDRLRSNATGSGVIVFQDESSARMGPNAELTIDEFVYDPARRGGTIRLRQTNGLARIYGGQISKRGRSEIRTPHIVLAVRGGIVDMAVLGGESVATLRGGLMVCRVGNMKKTITNPGFSCVSDGATLEIARLDETDRQLVTPAVPGRTTGGSRRYDAAHCASAAGVSSAACRSRDGALPGPRASENALPAMGRPGGSASCNPQNQRCG